jgi:hypothetical protein
VDACFGCLHGIVLVMRGACRAGKVVDPVYFGLVGEGYVMPDKLKVRLSDKVGDVLLLARKEVVKADDVISFLEKVIAQMASQKPRPAGNQGAGTQ